MVKGLGCGYEENALILFFFLMCQDIGDDFFDIEMEGDSILGAPVNGSTGKDPMFLQSINVSWVQNELNKFFRGTWVV